MQGPSGLASCGVHEVPPPSSLVSSAVESVGASPPASSCGTSARPASTASGDASPDASRPARRRLSSEARTRTRTPVGRQTWNRQRAIRAPPRRFVLQAAFPAPGGGGERTPGTDLFVAAGRCRPPDAMVRSRLRPRIWHAAARTVGARGRAAGAGGTGAGRVGTLGPLRKRLSGSRRRDGVLRGGDDATAAVAPGEGYSAGSLGYGGRYGSQTLWTSAAENRRSEP